MTGHVFVAPSATSDARASSRARAARALVAWLGFVAGAAWAGVNGGLTIPIQANVHKTVASTSDPTINGSFTYSVTCTPSPGGHTFNPQTINVAGTATSLSSVSGNASATPTNSASGDTDCVVTQTGRPAAPSGFLWASTPSAQSTGPINTSGNSVTTAQLIFDNDLATAITITGVANPVAGGTVTCAPNPVEISVGTSVCSAIADPGYSFSDWNMELTSCPGGSDGSYFVDSPTENCSVVANFISDNITIETAVVPVGSGSVVCVPPVVANGSTASCTATASPGFHLVSIDGCFGTASTTSPYVTGPVTAPCTVTATFAANTFIVTGVANPVAGGAVTCTSPVNAGASTTCTVTTNVGYTLTSINGCGGATSTMSPYSTGMVNADCTVTANYTLNAYVVTGVANPPAAGSVTCASPVNHGSTTTCTLSTNPGYTLTSISGCGDAPGTTSPYTTGTVTSACTVTANYALNSYPITVAAAPVSGGQVSCVPSPVPHGSTATCTVTTYPNYVYAGISGCRGTATQATTYVTGPITAACTVTAVFAIAPPSAVPTLSETLLLALVLLLALTALCRLALRARLLR